MISASGRTSTHPRLWRLFRSACLALRYMASGAERRLVGRPLVETRQENAATTTVVATGVAYNGQFSGIDGVVKGHRRGAARARIYAAQRQWEPAMTTTMRKTPRTTDCQ